MHMTQAKIGNKNRKTYSVTEGNKLARRALDFSEDFNKKVSIKDILDALVIILDRDKEVREKVKDLIKNAKKF